MGNKLIFFLLLFSGCSFPDSKIVRKKLGSGNSDNAIVRWYFYSYISNVSPDIVEISRNGKTEEIIRANRTIVDVFLRQDTIILRLVTHHPESTDIKSIPGKVGDYNIIIDSSGTYDDLNSIPLGIKE